MISGSPNVEDYFTEQERIINLHSLKELAGNDDQFICQLLELFIHKAPQTMGEVEKSFHSKDYEGLRYNVHSFKSTVSIFGNAELSNLVGGIEKMAMNKAKWSLVEMEMQKLFLVYEALMKEVVQDLQMVKAA